MQRPGIVNIALQHVRKAAVIYPSERCYSRQAEPLNPHHDICRFRPDFRAPGPIAHPVRQCFQPSPTVDFDRGTREAAHARPL